MEQAGWLSMLVSFIRTSSVEWLTNIDSLISAENKLLLSKIAPEVGADSPKSVIACSPASAATLLGTTNLVAKPIGPSNFILGNDHISIPTSSVASLMEIEFVPEPYLYQERIDAVRHLRVVTVNQNSWCYSKSVESEIELDWRYSEEGHKGFELTVDLEVESLSVALASKLGVRYSSQDWIDDGYRKWVVDVNPAGQWLFLQHSEVVTEAIASWLLEGINAQSR